MRYSHAFLANAATGSEMADHPRPTNKWHGDRLDPAERWPKSRRGQRLFALTALLLALLGAVLAIILYPNRMVAPTFIAMTIREFDSPLLPPNAWALQDGQLIAGTERFKKVDENYTKQYSEQFDNFLAKLRNAEGPLVVYVCALARVLDEEVVLFLGDTPPDQPHRGVPLTKLLDAMSGKTPGDRLLLLDVARPVADVRLGIASDDVAAAVHRELEQTSRSYFTLTACSPGQISHVSEELGASAFAYAIDLGFRGFAETNSDQRVSVKELAEYVRKQTDRWAWINRGQRQEPRLYGRERDFSVVQLGNDPPAAPEAPKDRTYPKWLKFGWAERDDLFNDGSYRLAPAKFRELEISLMRAEKRWRAGFEDDGRLAADVPRVVANSKEAIKRAAELPGPRPFSLAELKNEKTETLVREMLPKLDRYLLRVPESDAKKDDDKARIEETKKVKADLADELKKLPYESAAAAIVAAAVRPPNLTPGRIAASVELLAEVRPSTLSERRFAETVFLERLKDNIARVQENGDWQGATAHLALQTTVDAEDVLAELARTPSGFEPWNRDAVKTGEVRRRDGNKDIFTGLDFSWRDAQSAYLRAEQSFRVIPLRLATLRQIEESRDQAFVQLPGWASYVIALSRFDLQDDTTWRAGVQSARDLADALETKDLAALDGEPAALIQWRGHVHQWRKSIDARIERLQRLASNDSGKGPEYLEWNALLESCRFPAAQRESMWLQSRKLGLVLLKSMPPPNASDADFAAAGFNLGDDLIARQEADRKTRRIRLANDMFDLAGLPDEKSEDVAKLQNELALGVPKRFFADARAEDNPKDALALARPLARADRLSRVFADEIAPRLNGADFNPAFRLPARSLYQLQQRAFWSFMHERYQAEAKDLRGKDHDVFYAEAAAAYLRTP